MGDWLEHWAEVTPDKEYIVYSDRNLRFNWKQFNERVDQMAKGLLANGPPVIVHKSGAEMVQERKSRSMTAYAWWLWMDSKFSASTRYQLKAE